MIGTAPRQITLITCHCYVCGRVTKAVVPFVTSPIYLDVCRACEKKSELKARIECDA